MLIICSGPDTFRAQQKARELEQAFRAKYDAQGMSSERLPAGKEAVKRVVEQAGTLSLFSTRRFMRASDLLADCPKAQLEVLARVLHNDPEQTIVVSVEAEPLSETVLKVVSSVPKFITYAFPAFQGTVFTNWVKEQALSLGVQDQQMLQDLATATEGDTWLAWNELRKIAAGGEPYFALGKEWSTYEEADAYLLGGPEQYHFLGGQNSEDVSLSLFASQARSALRVRDGATQGLHPYLVKKMQRFAKTPELEAKLERILQALVKQRAGYGTEEEVQSLL